MAEKNRSSNLKKKNISHQKVAVSSPAKRNPLLQINIIWPMLLIALLTFIVYLSALKNGFTNWDDQVYVTDNPLLRDLSFEGFKKLIFMNLAGNHHPLTMLSLAFNYSIFKLNASSYHIFNVIVHIINCLLVFYFIYIISGRKMEIAFITALLFGIHPMHVESVAWVAARKDVLYTLFFISGLITYIWYIKQLKIKWLIITGLLFILSLLSKPAAIVFPVVLFLIDYFLKRKIDKRSIFEKIPLFLISIAFGILTIASQYNIGAMGEEQVYNLFQKTLFASYSLLVYLAKAIIPVHLSTFYPYPDTKEIPAFFYIAPFIVLGIIAAVIYFLRRKRMLIFSLIFFLVNIAMVLQLISFGSAILAERYTYVPYIGLFFVIGNGLSFLLRTHEKKFLKWKIPALLLLSSFTIVLVVATYQRNKVWKDSETLWTDVIKKYPDNSIGYYNRGVFFSNGLQYEKAIPDYSKAISIRKNYYEAHYNRAQAYRLTGQNRDAIPDYLKAMEIRPSEIKPYLNSSLAYSNIGEYPRALEESQKAVDIQPDNYETWQYRANAYFYLKDFNLALADYSKTIQLKPDYADAWFNRAVAYGKLGDKKNAMQDLIKAKELGHAGDTVLMNWLKK